MLITRCPNCNTAFRVTPEQLKAMQGKVRCGQCRLVFNAIDMLLDRASETVAATEPLPDLFETDVTAPAPTKAEEPSAEIQEELQGSPGLTEDSQEDNESPPEQIEPLLHRQFETAPRRLAWLWALAASFALLLLLLQVVLHFRVEFGILWPEAKPLLQEICMPLDCDIPLPSKGDLIGIESSDLRPGANGQLLMAATLKNRAPFAQTYPHLELTLTDLNDQPLLSKVLAPADYLPNNIDVASGFAMNGEIVVNLVLTQDNTGGSSATGYRLYLFYP